LKYDPETDSAPRLMARGRGHLGRKILEIARENGLPIRQDPDLIAALSALSIGWEIPVELYRAVAEVLAFAYRVGRVSREGGE
jgi:flagellar biosynthesis protein